MSDTPSSEPEATESSAAEPEPSTSFSEAEATSPAQPKVEVDAYGMPRPSRAPGAPERLAQTIRAPSVSAPISDTQPMRYASNENTLRSSPLAPRTGQRSRFNWGCLWRIF